MIRQIKIGAIRLMFCAAMAICLLSLPAHAADLAGNSATGVVQGTISQEALNGSENTINVGSIFISPEDSARDINVNALVEGDILVKTNGNSTVVNIGTYRGK